MSSVDERIVEMRFDNQQFESGVQKSLHTLDRLKSGLNLENSAKSLESLQTSANSLDLKGVANGVDAISNRVSALGIVGDQVIRYLTNQFIQLGESATRVVKSLSIDQISAGFEKYGQKTEAVQTIMNATGKSIDEVSTVLDKLNTYTDETSYNFTDMVSSIGKFTSAGVDLNVAEEAMEGIANWAATAGVGPAKAASAFYNLSQAISAGSMKMQDWKSINLLNMGTKQFKETAIETAIELGKLEKGQDGVALSAKKTEINYKNFDQTLHEGWLDTDVLLATLSKYSDQTTQFGLKAYHAAQEAKTFTDAIDATKDAVSTGWSKTFELIFGNYKEAKVLWTSLANELIEVFAGSAEKRNEILKEWHDNGGYQKMLNSIKNAWRGIKSIGSAVKEVFSNIIPEMTSDRLISLTEKFRKFTKSFRDNFVISDRYIKLFQKSGFLERSGWLEHPEKLKPYLRQSVTAYLNLQKLKSAVGGLVSIFDLGKFALKSFFRILSPIAKAFKESTGGVLSFAGSVGETITKIVNSIKESETLEKVIVGLTNIVAGSVKGLKLLGIAVAGIFKRVVESDAFKSIVSKVVDLGRSLYDLVGEKLIAGFNAVLNFFENLAKDGNIDAFLEEVDSALESLGDFVEQMRPAYESIKSFLTPIVTAIGGAFLFVASHIGPAIEGIKNLWTELKNSENPIATLMSKFSNLGTYIDGVKDSLARLFGYTDFSELVASLDPSFEAIKDRVTGMLDKIGNALKNANWGKIIATGIGLSTIPVMFQLGSVFHQLSGLLKSLTGVNKTFTKFLKRLTGETKTTLLDISKSIFIFAAAFGVLAGSLKLISTINSDDLVRSGIALGALAGGLAAIGLVFGILGALGKISDLDKSALALLEIAGALAILSGSLLLMQKLSWGDIGKGAVVIGGLMVMMSLFALAIKDTSATFAGNGLIFLSFAASIFLLVESIKRLSTIQNFDLHGSLAAIGTLMAIMAAFAVIQRLGKGSFGMGPGILSMTLSLMLLMKAASMLGDAKIAEIAENAKKNIGLIAGVFGAMIALSLIARLGGKNAGQTGLGILAMSGAILNIYWAVKQFGALKAGVLAKGVLSVIAILLVFSKLAKVKAGASTINAKTGLGIALMAASLLVVYQAVKKFGNLDIPELVQGLLSVGSIFGVFAGVMAASAKTVKAGPIIAMAAAITVLVGALAYLTLLNDFEGLAKSAAILDGVLVGFGVSMALMANTKFDKSTFASYIAGTIAIGTIAFSLYKLQGVPWEQLGATSAAISAVLLAVGESMVSIKDAGSGLSFGQFLANTGVLATGLAAAGLIGLMLKYLATDSNIQWDTLASFGGTITAVMVGIGETMDKVQGVDAGKAFIPMLEIIGIIAILAVVLGALSWIANKAGFDDSNVVQVQRIGAMLGGFVGGILGGLIGGAGLGMTIALPMMATDLSNFMTNLQPFLHGLDGLDESFGTKLNALGKGLIDIGKAEVKDGWANLLNSIAGGNGESPNMGKNMKALGQGLADFNAALANIDADTLSTNIGTLVTMLTAMNKVPKTRRDNAIGKTLTWFGETFAGKTDYGKFQEGMSEMGKALGSFAESTKGLNVEKLTPSVDAFGKIMEAFSQIPKTGPLIDFFSGKQEWSTISDGLAEFGKALSGYSKAVSGENAPDLDAITKSIESAEVMRDLLSSIPPTEGLDQKLNGEVKWSTISSGLRQFGTALTEFSAIVSGRPVDTAAIETAGKAGEALATLEGKIPATGGWWKDTFGGNVEWSTISKGLAAFGSALVKFSDAIKGDALDIDAMNGASTAAQKAIDACLAFRDAGMTTGEMGQLGSGLESFGGHLKGMSDMMVQFDTAAVDTVLESLQKLSEAKTTYESLGGELAEMIVSKFQLGLNIETTSSIASDFMTNISAGLTTGDTTFTSIGENCANALISGLTSKNETILQTGTDVGGKASSGMSTALAGMVSVGSQAAQGLINGLSEKLSEAYAAGYAIGQSVVSGSKAGLDAHSPSRLMKQVGEFAGEGLGLGLLSMTNYVSDSAEKMAEGSILSVSSVFDKIDAALSGDIDFSPVITPVLDMSAISYGASQIDGILNQDASLRVAGQLQTAQTKQDMLEFLALGNAILRELQNGSDLYFDDGAFAGRINRRLGSL